MVFQIIVDYAEYFLYFEDPEQSEHSEKLEELEHLDEAIFASGYLSGHLLIEYHDILVRDGGAHVDPEPVLAVVLGDEFPVLNETLLVRISGIEVLQYVQEVVSSDDLLQQGGKL